MEARLHGLVEAAQGPVFQLLVAQLLRDLLRRSAVPLACAKP